MDDEWDTGFSSAATTGNKDMNNNEGVSYTHICSII